MPAPAAPGRLGCATAWERSSMRCRCRSAVRRALGRWARTGAPSNPVRTVRDYWPSTGGMLDADFEVVDSPELVEVVRALADRYRRSVSGHA
ncbi:hypothetical protein GCM10027089_10860 [Nocardia thraciensis]